jgi:hypothetical protein
MTSKIGGRIAYSDTPALNRWTIIMSKAALRQPSNHLSVCLILAEKVG